MLRPFLSYVGPPGWLRGERVGIMTWWLRVRSPVEANFLSGVFSPLTSAKACEKCSRWLWKEKLCYYWCKKARKHVCVIDRHDITLAIKVALNPNTTTTFHTWSNFLSELYFKVLRNLPPSEVIA